MHTSTSTQPMNRKNPRVLVQQWLMSTSIRIALIVAIVVFTLLYVVQITTVSTKGNDIALLEQQVRELKQETSLIDVDIAEHRSMQSIQERLGGLGMVDAGTVTYMSAGDTAVALR